MENNRNTIPFIVFALLIILITFLVVQFAFPDEKSEHDALRPVVTAFIDDLTSQDYPTFLATAKIYDNLENPTTFSDDELRAFHADLKTIQTKRYLGRMTFDGIKTDAFSILTVNIHLTTIDTPFTGYVSNGDDGCFFLVRIDNENGALTKITRFSPSSSVNPELDYNAYYSRPLDD